MTKTELLIAVLCSMTVRLENEYSQLRNNVWYRNPTSLDLLEQIIALERLQAMQEITDAILRVLSADFQD